jgi:hypothetical protein
MGPLRNIYRVIFRPKEAFEYFDTNYSWSFFFQAIFIYLLANLIANSFDQSTMIISTSSWLIDSLIIFLIGFIFKLKAGDFFKLLAILAVSHLPIIFLAPIKIYFSYNFIFGNLLYVLTAIWVFYLNLLAISSVCKINLFRSFLLYMIPFITVLGVLFNFFLGFFSKIFALNF